MRLLAITLSLLASVACSASPTLWHQPTPEEKARAEQDSRRDDAEIAQRKQRELRERGEADSVTQAFSLQDVRDCRRLGLIRKTDRESARLSAVRAGGNRILAQHTEYTRFSKRGGLVREHDTDDYEMYRCDSSAESPH